MHVCVKLAYERDAAFKAKAKQEVRTKGMATQLTKAVKAETEVARLKQEQRSLVDQVCCYTRCNLLSIQCPVDMRCVIYMKT